MPSKVKSVVAVDLGSNTFRAIVYNCLTGEWESDFERIVKTADRMHLTGRISRDAIERIVKAAEDAAKVIDFDNAQVDAVTTAAMRNASNADEALDEIARRCGIFFRIIDDSKEAYYTMLAVRNRLSILNLIVKYFVLIDIGGASTEVMFYHHGVFESKSFPVGIVTVAQQCSCVEEVHTMLEKMLLPVREYVKNRYDRHGRPDKFVATAGTPTTIASFLHGMTYATYDPRRINGQILSLQQCGEALAALMAMDDETRARYVGVGKETLIAAGIVIVEEFYKLLEFEEAVIVDDGLREGVAIDYCLNN